MRTHAHTPTCPHARKQHGGRTILLALAHHDERGALQRKVQHALRREARGVQLAAHALDAKAQPVRLPPDGEREARIGSAGGGPRPARTLSSHGPVSHIFTLWSPSAPALYSRRPLPENVTADTDAVWPSSVCNSAPVSTSHRITAVSSDPVAASRPHGEMAQLSTLLLWPACVGGG